MVDFAIRHAHKEKQETLAIYVILKAHKELVLLK